MTVSGDSAGSTPTGGWNDALRELEEASRLNDVLRDEVTGLRDEVTGLRDELNRLRSRRVVRWTDALARRLRHRAGR
jgi:hypothetical protein